ALRNLWGEACLAANTILNQIPHKKRDLRKLSKCKVFGKGYVAEDFFKNIFPYKDKKKQVSNPRKRVMSNQLSQDETDIREC
nr:hypothetical protein CTI12_AA217490 [Tanacetum cinerariifolium]